MRFGKSATSLLSVLASAAVITACDDGTGPDGRKMTISFAVPRATSAAASSAADAGAAQRLVLTQVQVVLAEIELEREEEDDCDSSGPGNRCQEIEAGPVLIDLPVNGGMISPLSDPLPTGRFEELELEIERPDDDDAAARAFLAANPSWPKNASVRVRGTFDGQPFDIFLNAEAELELEFEPPLVIGRDDERLNITISIDLRQWFLNPDGTEIDPRALAADGNLRDRVLENIKRSFEAFEDDDRDGDEDD